MKLFLSPALRAVVVSSIAVIFAVLPAVAGPVRGEGVAPLSTPPSPGPVSPEVAAQVRAALEPVTDSSAVAKGALRLPANKSPFDSTYQFLFLATLEGLYRDGVPDADVKSLLATDGPNGGYLNFIYTCPICEPVEAAIVTYKERPRIDHLKIQSYWTKERTFGNGLPKEVSTALASPKASVRLTAVNNLVAGWVSYRMEHSGLSTKEKKALVEELKKGRKRGMEALRSFAAGLHGPDSLKMFAPGYQGGDECSICNAALQMPLKLKEEK